MKFIILLILLFLGSCNKDSYVNTRFLDATTGAPPATVEVRANNLHFTLEENTSLSQNLTYSSPDSSPITFEIISSVSHGSLVLTDPSTGLFLYTPSANWQGQDSFTYKVLQNNLESNVATVVLNVTFVNTAPTISSIAAASTSEGTAKAINFTISDLNSSLSCSSTYLSMNSSNTSLVPNTNVS